MFSLFRKDPIQKLEKQYADKLRQARDAQRDGKIPIYATLSAEAASIAAQIDELRQQASAG